MSLRSRTIIKKDPLKEKIIRNPKFKDIQPLVDTGASVTRYARQIARINERFRFRTGEIFKRIKVSAFVKLVLEVVELERDVQDQDLKELDNAQSLQLDLTGAVSARDSYTHDAPMSTRRDGGGDGGSSMGNGSETARSSLQSVIAGLGELDVRRGRTSAPSPLHTSRGGYHNRNAESDDWWSALTERAPELDICSKGVPIDLRRYIAERNRERQEALERESRGEESPPAPYLLLDVRDRDEYDAAHVRTAVSYPSSMLSRTANSELAIMRSFRNVSGCIIVIYDEDELIACRVATALVQRGYDNLFVLSGGLRVARKLFPEGLIVTRGANLAFDHETIRKLRDTLQIHLLRSSGNSTVSTTRTSSRGSLGSTSRFTATYTPRSVLK